MIQSLYTRDTFKHQSEEFRIGAIISDGMWYSIPKWRKAARVKEETLREWVDTKLSTGELVQSPDGTPSYRFPKESMEQWYESNAVPLRSMNNVQLLDFSIPAHIWDGMTEVDGFNAAPRRECGVVSFTATNAIAAAVKTALRGVARVVEVEPGRFKCYSLEASYVKRIIEEVFQGYPVNERSKPHLRSVSKRREIVDFSPEFSRQLVTFYKHFGKILVRGYMETIKIFIPEPEDQEGQIVMWVLEAIEKFDNEKPVPFPGYLFVVLNRWPYDLPTAHLGEELANFQRQRSRALKALRKESEREEFSAREIADKIGITQSQFIALESNHKSWLATRNAVALTWADSNEERDTAASFADMTPVSPPSDVELSNKLSLAAVKAALETERFNDAFGLISQIDVSDINMSAVKEISEEYIQALGVQMGMGNS